MRLFMSHGLLMNENGQSLCLCLQIHMGAPRYVSFKWANLLIPLRNCPPCDETYLFHLFLLIGSLIVFWTKKIKIKVHLYFLLKTTPASANNSSGRNSCSSFLYFSRVHKQAFVSDYLHNQKKNSFILLKTVHHRRLYYMFRHTIH